MLREHQTVIIDKIHEGFEQGHRCQLLWGVNWSRQNRNRYLPYAAICRSVHDLGNGYGQNCLSRANQHEAK